ncbi:MAG: hypothetical protein ACPGWM_05500, partial [Flavobacteriales bacterium]
CKKDEDSTLPSIRFTVPSGDFNSYSFGDLIPVRIEVSDDTELAKLVLVIQGTTNDQILASFSKSLSGIEQTISRSFPFDDVHIGSDTFLIKATVEDQAGNTKTAFREIQIFEAPLELLTIGTVSQSGSSVRIDTLGNGNFNFASQFQGDVSACAMGSYFQELLIGEASNATIQVIEPENWQVSSSYSAGGSISIDHFRDIYFDRSALRYYCSTFDGKIVVLKRDAFLASTIDLPQGYEAQQVITANGFIICSALQTGTSNYVLISFNQQTGIFQSSINLGFVPIELVSFDNDILVCSSSAIEVFNPSSGDLTNFNWLASSEPITAVVEGFADYYAVAHADGIYFYKFGENLLVFPNNQLVAKELHFNPINNLVYALTETELALVNGSNASVVSNFPVSSETEHLFLRFNK